MVVFTALVALYAAVRSLLPRWLAGWIICHAKRDHPEGHIYHDDWYCHGCGHVGPVNVVDMEAIQSDASGCAVGHLYKLRRCAECGSDNLEPYHEYRQRMRDKYMDTYFEGYGEHGEP
jgi:hypothetical protein